MRLTVARFRPLVIAALVAVAVAVAVPLLRPPAPPTAHVIVAARDLPAGAVLHTGDVTEAQWPLGTRPDGNLARDRLAGMTLASGVRRGEPITDARVVGPGLLRDAAPGTVAVPVRIADATAAGLVRIGDVIDLYAVSQSGYPTSQSDVFATRIPTSPDEPTPDDPATLDDPATFDGPGASDDPEAHDASSASGRASNDTVHTSGVGATGMLARGVRVIARLEADGSGSSTSGLLGPAESVTGSVLVVAASEQVASILATASGLPIALVLRTS